MVVVIPVTVVLPILATMLPPVAVPSVSSVPGPTSVTAATPSDAVTAFGSTSNAVASSASTAFNTCAGSPSGCGAALNAVASREITGSTFADSIAASARSALNAATGAPAGSWSSFHAGPPRELTAAPSTPLNARLTGNCSHTAAWAAVYCGTPTVRGNLRGLSDPAGSTSASPGLTTDSRRPHLAAELTAASEPRHAARTTSELRWAPADRTRNSSPTHRAPERPVK